MAPREHSLKRIRRAAWCRAALLLLFPALGGFPLGAVLDSQSTLQLDGTHNHGRWHCAAAGFGATVNADMTREALLAALARADAGGDANPADCALWPTLPPRVQLQVPVKSFDCGNPKMEHDLRRSLRAKEFPVIVFDLHRIESARVLRPGRYAISIAGALRLAGVEREEEIELLAERTAPDRFRFTAVLPVKMSDFEIDPPVALFGLIRAAAELKISFDLTFVIAKK